MPSPDLTALRCLPSSLGSDASTVTTYTVEFNATGASGLLLTLMEAVRSQEPVPLSLCGAPEKMFYVRGVDWQANPSKAKLTLQPWHRPGFDHPPDDGPAA